MEAVSKSLWRYLLLFFLFQPGTGRIQQGPTIPGVTESTCFSNLFWMKLDKSIIQGKHILLYIIDHSGVAIALDKKLEARCGYFLSEDVWGNLIFRASVLSCHVINERDERFSLTVNIEVSSFRDMRAATVYTQSLHCTYSPWAPREIVCEQNYMEVSVKSDVPVISDKTSKWMPALPEVRKVAYQIWKLIFHSPSGPKTTVASDADKLGYSFNNTLARVFLRSPYVTNETELSVVNGVAMSTISSTSMYKQRWLLLMIDTTVSCPTDGTSFTDASLTWTVPSIIPKLVLQETTFISYNISMGVDGQRIENPESLDYTLERNITHIGITIPIGASGGRLKSTVSNGVHGVTYSIDLYLEHTWTDIDWHLTKYTVLKQITTPFMPRIPTVINNTVPNTRLFDIAFGVFLPEVSVQTLTVGDTPLTPKEAKQKGYMSPDTTFPNGTKSFNLKVPFDDPNVLKEYVNRNETKYLLRVNYTLSVGPEKKPYHHPADIECVVADIELPEAVGYCDKESMYLAIPTTGLFQHWSLYVGNKRLNQATALSYGYVITTNATHLVLQVPLFAVGITYEEMSFESLKTRFDLALKKTITMETLEIFSVRCSFNPLEFIVCYPNGTVVVSAYMKTIPSIDMSKTRLKDKTCKPKQFTKERAFFQFHVSRCGTTVRVRSSIRAMGKEMGNCPISKHTGPNFAYLDSLKENILFMKMKYLLKKRLFQSRDHQLSQEIQNTGTTDKICANFIFRCTVIYKLKVHSCCRLTVLCYYTTKETLIHSAMYSATSLKPPTQLPSGPDSGIGTMIVRSHVAGFRRGRQVLNVISRLFQDKSFREIHGPHSTVVKYLWEPIFLEFELKDGAPDAELFLDDCWITGSKEFGNTSQWNIIVDGCETNGGGSMLDFYSVNKNSRVEYPKHFKRVGIRMWTPLDKVYIHCTVTVSTCFPEPGNGFSCRQQCPRRKPDLHFETHPNLHGYVVAGPVFVVHTEQMKELDADI